MDQDQMVIFIAVIVGSILLAVFLMQTYFDARRIQQKKEEQQKMQQRANQVFVRKMRVLEQIVEKTESRFCNPSYLLESEGGERVVLRCPIAKNIPLAVGDVGMVEYQGDYIRSFQLLERKETSSI